MQKESINERLMEISVRDKREAQLAEANEFMWMPTRDASPTEQGEGYWGKY